MADPIAHLAPTAPPPQIDIAGQNDFRVDLLGLDRAALLAEMTRLSLPRFRADQLWHWIYHRGVTDFNEMTTLAKPLRMALSETH